MNGPHPALTRHYGNEHLFLQKEAGSASLAARVALGLITAESMRRFYDTIERGRQQSEMRARAIQTEDVPMMRQMTHHHAVPIFVGANLPAGGQPMGLSPDIPLGMDEGMVRMASIMAEAGADMAKVGVSLQPVKSLLHDAGKMLKGAPVTPRGSLNRAQYVAPHAPPKPVTPLASPTAATQPAYRQTAAPAATTPVAKAEPSVVIKDPAAPVEKAPNALVQGAKTVGKGIGTAGALGLGAAGLGLYGLTRAGAGIMSQENQPSDWGGANYGASQPVYGINQYGYAQRGSPFVY